MTRASAVGVLLLLAGCASLSPSKVPDLDCHDFRSWRAANTAFLEAGGPEHDPHRLDADHDGIPCESLRQR
ncbi:MAG: excalibur calcium-binding domain-containing protein [Bacteroidota bacterium]